MTFSVIEPFLYDPTVAWGRQGRAQRSVENALNLQKTIVNQSKTAITKEEENLEAKEALNRINGQFHPLIISSPRNPSCSA
jgi:hypothetical protein